MLDFNSAVNNINPTKGVKNSVQPRVLKAQFGDGYVQRSTDGINSISETWTISFVNRTTAEGDLILEFLEARGGVEAFSWTPPYASSAIHVVCYKWDSTLPLAPDTTTVNCTFTKVFE